MIFVPYIPPPQPPSPRTQELASLLGRVIEEYEKHHPAVSGQEVQAALHMAASSSRKAAGMGLRIALAVGVGMLVAVGGIVLLASSAGPGGVRSLPAAGLSVAVILLVLLVAVVARRGPG